MKKFLVLLFILFPVINCIGQDEEGYIDISRNVGEGSVRYISTPIKFIMYNDFSDMDAPNVSYSISYYILKEDDSHQKDNYMLDFVIYGKDNLAIPKGGRLLLKHKDGQTLTLTTENEHESEYSDGKYIISANYNATKDNIDAIIDKGVIKLRFETVLKNFDITPKNNMASFTQEFVDGIENRLKSKKDSFTSDF